MAEHGWRVPPEIDMILAGLVPARHLLSNVPGGACDEAWYIRHCLSDTNPMQLPSVILKHSTRPRAVSWRSWRSEMSLQKPFGGSTMAKASVCCFSMIRTPRCHNTFTPALLADSFHDLFTRLRNVTIKYNRNERNLFTHTTQ